MAYALRDVSSVRQQQVHRLSQSGYSATQGHDFWHIEVLKKNRMNLIEYINIEDTLLPRLYQNVLTKPEYKRLQNEYHSVPDRINALLDVIESKPSEKYLEFRECLVQEGQRHVVKEYLPDKPPPVSLLADLPQTVATGQGDLSWSSSFTKLQKCFQSHYQNEFVHVRVFPWYEENCIPLSSVYVNMVWEKRHKQMMNYKYEKLQHYAEVFENPGSKLVYVYGIQGIGKTTFCHILGLDWVTKEIKILNDFDLIIILSLRAFRAGESLGQVIWRELLNQNPEFSPDQITDIMKECGERCLVILDGLDELAEETPEITDIRAKKSSFKVLITSRPIGDDVLKHADVTAIIRGYETKGIQTYLKNFFKKDENYEGCKAEIERNKDLHELCKVPLLLHLLCLLYDEYKSLPSTLTGIYVKLEDFVLRRYKSMMAEKGKNVDPNQLQETLTEMKHLAYQTTVSSKLIFEQHELTNQNLYELGFLSSWTVYQDFTKKLRLTYIHKSFADYFCCKYLVKHHQKEETTEFWELCKSKRKVLGIVNLFSMCCGIDGEAGVKMLEQIQNSNVLSDDMDRYKTELHDFQMQALCEASPQVDISSLRCYSEVYISQYNYFIPHQNFRPVRMRVKELSMKMSNNSIIFTQEDGSQPRTLRLSPDRMEVMELMDCNLDSSSDAMFSSRELQHINSVMEVITYFISNSPNLQKLNLSGNNLGGGLHHLQKISHETSLRELNMRGCKLRDSDMEGISKLISNSPNLQKLNLSGNNLGGGLHHLLKISHKTSLRELYMMRCELRDSDMEGVAHLLKMSPCMKKLDLWFNGDVSDAACRVLRDVLQLREEEMIVVIPDKCDEAEWSRILPQHDISSFL